LVQQGSPVPLWQQVIDLIRRNIESGAWAPDTQIPSERELCDQFGISRTTVRQALAEAETEGLLMRIHGKGTYVASPRVRQPLFQITGFEETLRTLGLTPGARLLEFRQVAADVPTASLLDLAPGSEVCRVHMLGLGSGEPMAVYESVVPGAYGTTLREEIERRRAVGRTFFVSELLAECNGWSHVRADQTYEAIFPERAAARLLGLSGRTPAFRVTSLFRDPAGRPFEFRQAVYRGDRYQFHVIRQMFFAGKEEER
jgi:GntR family transcriptional regulator